MLCGFFIGTAVGSSVSAYLGWRPNHYGWTSNVAWAMGWGGAMWGSNFVVMTLALRACDFDDWGGSWIFAGLVSPIVGVAGLITGYFVPSYFLLLTVNGLLCGAIGAFPGIWDYLKQLGAIQYKPWRPSRLWLTIVCVASCCITAYSTWFVLSQLNRG